jgi:hypothetical protein
MIACGCCRSTSPLGPIDLKALLGLGFFARSRVRSIDSITASCQHFCQSEPSTATDCFASWNKNTRR